MRILIITLTLLTLALPAVAQADGPPQYSGYSLADPEGEFYRGVGAACDFALRQGGMTEREITLQCLYFISIAKDADWYHQPAPQWEMKRQPVGWGNET